MTDKIKTLHNIIVLECAEEGKQLSSEQDAVDLIGTALETGAEVVVIPVSRLEPAFFELKTRLAGNFIQKFVNYRRRLAILGDVSAYIAESKSFKDFVYETNRGNQFWFVAGQAELDDQIQRLASSQS